MSTKDAVNFVVVFFLVTAVLGCFSIVGAFVYLTAIDKPVSTAFANIAGQAIGFFVAIGGVMVKDWLAKLPAAGPVSGSGGGGSGNATIVGVGGGSR